MDTFDSIAEGSQPVVAELREQVLEPFITATCAMLPEWVNTAVVVQAVYRKKLQQTYGEMATRLSIHSTTEGTLILNVHRRTGAALAERILTDTTTELTDDIIHDCLGEIANVIAGHAKALVAGTPYRFTFSTPTVLSGIQTLRPEPTDCLVVVFRCDVGDFVLQLFQHL